MFAALFVATCPPAKLDDVYLDDVLRFGVCYGIATCNLKCCERHTSNIVGEFPDWQRWAWEFRQEQARYAWYSLQTALDEREPKRLRLESLQRLRQTIGEQAYDAGRMIPPVPNYGVWMPVK